MKTLTIPKALLAFGLTLMMATGSVTGRDYGTDTGRTNGMDTARGNGMDTARGNGMDTARGNGMDTARGNGMAWRKDSVTATIEEVMADSGLVVLRGPRGRMHTLKVDRNVNLRNFKKGDRVTATLYQAQAVEFREPTAEDRRRPFVVEERKEAPKGTRPMMGELRQIRALATITNIDKRNNTVTVQGPMGRSYVVEVKDRTMLDRLRRGQEFVVVFKEGIVAEVTKQR
ncbi:MAG: hypothetical protein GF344_01780 [Chitinivibrionales bacterium]|nr:hypothetical protein [Chitinivibrionales bacterium]MBD3355822.1 hypothetical protein [Chitinivibrionales bacterium]